MMPLLEFVENGEFKLVPGYLLIFFTIAATAQTGQRITSSDAIRVMVPIFSSFFWHLK